MTESKGDYVLSAVLEGHAASIRDLHVVDDNHLAVAELYEFVRLWERQADSKPPAFKRLDVFKERVTNGKEHIYRVLVGHIAEYTAGPVVIAGKGEGSASVFTSSGALLYHLPHPKRMVHGKPYTNVIGSLAIDAEGRIVTGSWDGNARVWSRDNVVQVLGGHENAVHVCVLPGGQLITADAAKTVRVYVSSGPGSPYQVAKEIREAHKDPIKTVVPHPLGFATAGNDGFVRVWSADGASLFEYPALVEAEIPWIHSLAILPDNKFATGSEDGTVRVFGSDGTLEQKIQLPGTVYCVRVMPNGDLATGCADRSVRIFTKNAERFADESKIASFQSLSEMAAAQGPKKVKADDLPDESALTVPGDKDGAIKMVNCKGQPTAFVWNASKQSWDEIGNVLGAQAKKKVVNGIEYDQVVDIDVNGGQKVIPLGFNVDDDPKEIAKSFAGNYGLGKEYEQQIADYIGKHVDYKAVEAKKKRMSEEADAKRLIHVPSWVNQGFQVIANGNFELLKSKLMQFNDELAAAGDVNALSDAEKATAHKLVATLSDIGSYATASLSQPEQELVVKLLSSWPSAKIVPVMDAFRLLMCHNGALETIATQPEVWQHVLRHATVGPIHLQLASRAVAHYIAKRPRVPSERAQPPSVPEGVLQIIREALRVLAGAATSDMENTSLAYLAMVHNLVAWMGRTKLRDDVISAEVIRGCVEAAQKHPKPSTMFYSLLTIGSLGEANPVVKADLMKTPLGAVVLAVVNAGLASADTNCKTVATDAKKVFGIKP